MSNDCNVNAKVALTSEASKQCARWDCLRSTSESVYCRESCLALVTSDAQSRLPACTTNVYSSATKFAGVASKILKSQDLLQIPPWESDMFDYEFTDQRVEYCNWIFIGLYPVPNSMTTSGFKWEGGRVKRIGEVNHCVFKPTPGQDGKWKLHQFSSPDLMGKAVYLMHCDKYEDGA